MPSRSKVMGNRAVGRQKTLGMPRGFKPLHAIFPLACRPMRILTAVIEIATLAMLHPGQDLTLRRTVALQLVRNDDARHVLQALQQLAEKLLRRLLVASALHEDIEDVVVLVDRAPEVMALTINREKYLIQVPLVPWLRTSMLQLIGVVLSKLQTPLADGLVGHRDAALEQDFLHIAVAQREAIIEPDAMADDLAGEAMVLIGSLASDARGPLSFLAFPASAGALRRRHHQHAP